MEETTNPQANFWKDASNALNRIPSFYGAYTDFLTQMVQNNLKMAGDAYSKMASPTYGAANQSDCCPPKKACPPRCLAEIVREACEGEVIVVPFSIKNKCGGTKTYRIGMRQLVDQHGNAAPMQPSLNRDTVILEPGQSIAVLMTVNLMQGFEAGNTYSADIVIREAEVNQNVCFKLNVRACGNGPEVCPLDEKEYLLHWQSWQDHFYCEQKPAQRPGTVG
jgi:hypothetical protein